MSKPRAVFLGTPRAAVPILESLVTVADVALVVTRADKPRGRSKRLIAPAVKAAAVELGLEVTQPTDRAALHEAVAAVGPDVAVVAAYGRIIAPDLLAVPDHGFVNVHYSLLPRWRGASPVTRAILAGDDVTGVSLMQMDAGLDTGPVFATLSTDIEPTDTTGTLTTRLAFMGAELLRGRLPQYLAGSAELSPQDEEMATAAAKVTTDEAHIDPLRHSAISVDRAVRAFDPAPGSWCRLEDERFKIWQVAAWSGAPVEPGRIVLHEGAVLLGARDATLELIEVQPPGKGRMAAAAWMNGRRGEPAIVT